MIAADPLADALAAHRAGRPEAAIPTYRRLLAEHPENPDLRHLLALALQGIDPALAHAELRRALVLAPSTALYLHNAARLTANEDPALGRRLARALALDPAPAEAHHRLGVLAGRSGRHDRAAPRFRRALALLPGSAESWHMLAMALTNDAASSEVAITAARRAIAISPAVPEPYLTLALPLLHQGRVKEALHARRTLLALEPGDARAHWDFLPLLHLDPDLSPADQMAFRRRVHRRFSDPLTLAAAPHGNDRDPDRRLRLGYVDDRMLCLSTHSTNLLPTIEAHDPKEAELYFYTNLPEAMADDMTGRYRATAAGFRHTGGLSDEEVADLVRADGIDILIDVSSHLTGTRTGVFARKPAPIQVTMMQVGSSGLAAMDYAVADNILLPTARPSFFTEEIIRLPVGFLFEPVADLTPPLSPHRAHRPPTFGSLNQLSKIDEPVLALWARVLARAPGSRLLMKAAGLASPAVRRRISRFFEERGIAPGRLDLRAWTGGYSAHLATFEEIDVVLDCFPYPGMTTSLEALLMGVPVVTLAGDRFVARIGEAILKAVGHPEWIAADADGYVAVAASLAGDPERLARLKGCLRDELMASPLGDPRSFTRGLEAAFRDAWRRWCRTQPGDGGGAPAPVAESRSAHPY